MLPSDPSRIDGQQDRIRLRNLSARAIRELRNLGAGARRIKRIVDPLKQLEADGKFWRRQSAGLLLCSAGEGVTCLQLPYPCPEGLLAGEQYYLAPVWRALEEAGSYVLLALSQKRTRLFQRQPDGLAELAVPGMPAGIAEVLRFIETDRQVQSRSQASAPASHGRSPALFHGHDPGTGSESEHKQRIFELCRLIDQALTPFLRQYAANTPPLIVAGVDYSLPLFRQACRYPRISAQSIKGSPDELSEQQLRDAADAIFRAQQNGARKESIRSLVESQHTALASFEPREAAHAAYYGAVQRAFLRQGAQVWDPLAGLQNDQPPGFFVNGALSFELCDFIARYTFRNGGDVQTTDAGQAFAFRTPAAVMLRRPLSDSERPVPAPLRASGAAR